MVHNTDGDDSDFLGKTRPNWDRKKYWTVESRYGMLGTEMTRTDYFKSKNKQLKWSHVTDSNGDINIVLDWGRGLVEQKPVPDVNFWLPECA